MKHIYLIGTLSLFSLPLVAQNALQRSGKGLEYHVEAQVSAADGKNPFWLTANRYGLSSVDGSNGYFRAGISRDVRRDSLKKWRIGYGLDAAVSYNFTSTAILHQLYADFDYKLVRLTVGAKEQPMAFKNPDLSTGGQTFGINSRPVPEVRIGLPEYWNITGKGNWAAIRGHVSYGMMTDGRFQEDYVTKPNANYARHTLLCTKAGYLRLGNKEKFPLTFEGGLEMACQFGATAYKRGNEEHPVKMPHNLKAFIEAFFGGGGDPGEGVYANSTGNSLGSWLVRLNYHGKDWRVSAYMDHFFEDHSQMFFEYGWRDGMYGLEVAFPKNRVVSGLVYEYSKTTYGSGAVYKDHTSNLPDQISGTDWYYNHYNFAGWSHWGMGVGNPLFVSPLYFDNGSLEFPECRFQAHHLGINGDPRPDLHYRLLYTHERSIASYGSTRPIEGLTTHSVLAEAHYAPARLGRLDTRGWSAKLGVALDRGDLVGNNLGFSLTITKRGLLTK